jgi:hypothetical protein
MAMTVVNGYLCMNGCDAAKARTGQNPHASTDGSNSGSSTNAQTNNATRSNAVSFGGALAGLNKTGASATPSQAGGSNAPAPSVDVLA